MKKIFGLFVALSLGITILAPGTFASASEKDEAINQTLYADDIKVYDHTIYEDENGECHHDHEQYIESIEKERAAALIKVSFEYAKKQGWPWLQRVIRDGIVYEGLKGAASSVVSHIVTQTSSTNDWYGRYHCYNMCPFHQ